MVSVQSGDYAVIRGNEFIGNYSSGDGSLDSASEAMIYGCYGAEHATIELNKTTDPAYTNARFIYWTTNSNDATVQYNYSRAYSRLRMAKGHTIQHNIFDNIYDGGPGIELHDQCSVTSCPLHPGWDYSGKEDYDAAGSCIDESDEGHTIFKEHFL